MFEIAFKMFDLNGDGNIEYDEFEKVGSCCVLLVCIILRLVACVSHYSACNY